MRWLRIVCSPLVGGVLVLLLGGWAVIAHPDAPQTPAWVAACAVVAGGVLVGAGLSSREAAIPGLLALAVAVGAVVVTLPESLSGGPLAPPLGYMNANGSLLIAGALGGVVAVGSRPLPWRLAAAGTALGLAGVCLVDGAQAAAVTCVLAAGWALLRGFGSTTDWVAAGVAIVSVPPALTVGWASGLLPRPGSLVNLLSEERFDLWEEAWEILGDDPVSGVGPGRFAQEAPTAADPDLAWAHSAVLQTGAELGLVGVGLLVLIVIWALLALGRDGVLLGLLLLPASVDYVLHFGGVLFLSSLVLGGALGSRGPAAPWRSPWSGGAP